MARVKSDPTPEEIREMAEAIKAKNLKHYKDVPPRSHSPTFATPLYHLPEIEN